MEVSQEDLTVLQDTLEDAYNGLCWFVELVDGVEEDYDVLARIQDSIKFLKGCNSK